MNLFKSSPFKISYLIFLFIVSLCPSVFAGAPDTLWTRTYGGAKSDFGYEVQQTSDGGFIITGSSNSFSEFDNHKVYLIRINESGDTLWTRTYGGGHSSASVQETSDGGFVIAGGTSSNETSEDAYLIRTDSNGDTLWTKTYGGIDREYVNAMQQTSDGGFVISGYIESSPIGNVYLIRTNSQGDTLWTKSYGGDSTKSRAYSVFQTSDNGFIISGYKISLISNYNEFYLIRTDSNGDTTWTKTYGEDSSTNISYSVLQTDDGGFACLGYKEFEDKKPDVYLLRTNSNGDSLWSKTYGGTDWEWGYSFQQLADNGFLIVGNTESFGVGNYDVYIIRTDSSGDTLWTKTIGGAEADVGKSVQQTSDGGYIIAGETRSFGIGEADVYIIRLGKDSTAIQGDNQKKFLNQNDFAIIGDNRNNLISIRYTINHPSSIKLSMYNISGQLVKTVFNEHKNRGEYSEQFKTDKISSGVYYVTLEAGERRYARKSVVVE